MPLTISVITAVMNRANTIGDTLASVSSQTWPNVEHIVIDGASTDGTLEVLRNHQDQLSVMVSEPDNGIYDALNKGIARATGDIVGFLHSDDRFASVNVLSRVAAAFEDPRIDGVYGDLEYTPEKSVRNIVRRWRAGTVSRKKLRRGWMPPHPTLYVRREVYEKWGLYDATYSISADYDMVLRLFANAELNFSYIPEVLVRMRAGGISNRDVMEIIRKWREDYRAIRFNDMGGLLTLALKNLRKINQVFV